MARNVHPLIRLRGTIHDLTFVDSQAYGPHVRARRGSYKTAVINETLRRNARRTALLNQAAQPVHHFLKHLAGDFKQRDLWQEMLRRMRGCRSNRLPELLGALKGLEINGVYSLERLGPVPRVVITYTKKKVVVEVGLDAAPYFSQKAGVDGFRYETVVLWLDGEGREAGHCRRATGWMTSSEVVGRFSQEHRRPAKALYFVVTLLVAGGNQGEEVNSFAAKGMRVVEAGGLRS